jgi:hypothetical protein
MGEFPREMPLADLQEANSELQDHGLENDLRDAARNLEAQELDQAQQHQESALNTMGRFLQQMQHTKQSLLENQQRQVTDEMRRALQDLLELSKRQEQLDEAKRFIDLAKQLKSPLVRVFPDKWVEGEPHETTVDRIVKGLHELGAYAKGSGVAIIVETHGDFPHSAILLELMKKANMPNVGLLWDTHHTYVAGKEAPAETFKMLGSYVRHVHLKDSVPGEKEVRGYNRPVPAEHLVQGRGAHVRR